MYKTSAFESLHLTGSWVSIGMFDGVHRGHQAILRPMAEKAHAAGASAVAITFYPAPRAILSPDIPYQYLCTQEEEAELMESMGIDILITLPFTMELAKTSAEDFMIRATRFLSMRELWVGTDFALGAGRKGNVLALKLLGSEDSFSVTVIPDVEENGEKISSTRIRSLLASGDMDTTTRLLGRYYTVNGIVSHGDKRGRTIGFPTANLSAWSNKLIPAGGVYACWAHVNEKTYPAVTNIGVRPTFEFAPVVPRIEAHLLGFDGDIYGQNLRLEFISRLRAEKKFSSIQELIQQIQIDIQSAEAVFHP